MALRQYVGARYVPKFSDVNGGEWDNTYTYEPLTIVKHGNDYYTSKKEVPTGIAIINTEYWVLTGNYNGAISELNDRITDLASTVQGYDDAIETLNDDFSQITGGRFYPEDYGAKGDGLTDDSAAINECITAAFNARGLVVFSPKTYGISSHISIESPIYIEGNFAKIKALAVMSDMLDLDCLDPIPSFGRGLISNLYFDADYKATAAVKITNNINVAAFRGIQVINPVSYAFDCASSLVIDDVIVRNTDNTHLNVVGIRLNGSDNYVSNYMAVNCVKSMIINGGVFVYRNISWNSFPGLMKTSVFAEVNAVSFFNECMVDTWAYCFTGTAVPLIANTRFYWSNEYYTDASVGDSTTKPILFSQAPWIFNCRSFPARGRTDFHVLFSSTVITSQSNPEFGNFFEAIQNLPITAGYEFTATLAAQFTATKFIHKRYRDAIANKVIIDVEGSAASDCTSATPIVIINSGDDRPENIAIGICVDVVTEKTYAVNYQPSQNRFVVQVPSGDPITAGHGIKAHVEYYPKYN